jgi:predicted O-methyltransferase YrrM
MKQEPASFAEREKFENRRKSYNDYLAWMKKQNITTEDFLHNSAAYIGDMQIHRMLTIYELYKQTIGLAGHVAEVGVFKGAGSILLAKLVKIFEPDAFTIVHGFDWFCGKSSNNSETAMVAYNGDYERVIELKNKQSLDGILKIHRINIIDECQEFFEKSPQLKFKIVFMDIASYEVMKVAIPLFWQRLLPNGIMVFDHYSLQTSPGETIALSEVLPNAVVRTIPNSWTPNAYVVKGAS